jgi:hypothetical protein
MNWKGLKNGELIRAAEEHGIEVFVTGDQTIKHEQNLARRKLAIVSLSAIQLPILRKSFSKIIEAIDRAMPGSF